MEEKASHIVAILSTFYDKQITLYSFSNTFLLGTIPVLIQYDL